MHVAPPAVDEVRDRRRLRALLAEDRVAAAYLLGDLDERFFDDARFFVAEADGRAAVLLLYLGLTTPAVLTVGDAGLLEAIVDAAPLPPRFHAHLLEPHLESFEARFGLEGRRRMRRMAVDAARFSPAPPALAVRPLGPDDAPILPAIYVDYPGHFYEQSQLARGVYLGGFDGTSLVAVAGTHVYAPEEGVAAIGNVVTVRARRGRGHAADVVSRLLETLLPDCPAVVLNVFEGNTAARASYRRVGFTDHLAYVEAVCTRRAGR